MIGIYIVINNTNGKVYIGQSKTVERRLQEHKSALIHQRHFNKLLQESYNKDNNFSFELLEECSLESLDEKEVFWIKKYNSTSMVYGYNIENGGKGPGRITEAIRAGKRGEKNPMFNKKLTKEHLDKLIISSRGKNNKLTPKEVEEIKILLTQGVNLTELSQKYNTHVATIGKIKSCVNWGYIREDLNPILLAPKLKKIKPKTYTQLMFERNNKIKEEYQNGIDPKELTIKYNLGMKPIRKILGLKHKYTEDLKEQAINLRKSGMLVKCIAKELNIHRTTVSDWTKHLK